MEIGFNMREDRQQRKDQYADISDNATNLCEEIFGHVAELYSDFSVTYLYWARAWLAKGCRRACFRLPAALQHLRRMCSAGRVLIIHNRGDWTSVMYQPILCIIQQSIVPHRVVPHFSWFFTLFVAPEPVSQ